MHTTSSGDARVFLLDDHEVVRRGVRELLEAESDLEVVGEAGTAEEAYERIPAATPDVAMLDVRLPDGDGVEVCREIRSKHPEDRVPDAHVVRRRRGVVQRDHGGRGRLRLEAGPRHRSRRRCPPGRPWRVAARSAVDEQGARAAAAATTSPTSSPVSPNQERRILDLIAEGMTNRQIGEQLFLAEKTVKNYVSNLLAKLGMSRRTRGGRLRRPPVRAPRAPRPPALSERRLPSAARLGVRGEGARPSLGTIGFAGEEVVLTVDNEALGFGGEAIAELPSRLPIPFEARPVSNAGASVRVSKAAAARGAVAGNA